jgi:hypothetical protein
MEIEQFEYIDGFGSGLKPNEVAPIFGRTGNGKGDGYGIFCGHGAGYGNHDRKGNGNGTGESVNKNVSHLDGFGNGWNDSIYLGYGTYIFNRRTRKMEMTGDGDGHGD